MELEFRRVVLPGETEVLAEWFSNEEQPFHSKPHVTKERVFELVKEGYYSEPQAQTFWIIARDGQQQMGLIRLFDLEDIGDGSQLFDLRILKRFRGQGIGKIAVTWLTRYFFESRPEPQRVEGIRLVFQNTWNKT